MSNFSVYEDIVSRTGGDIYIGVVGPVRTGKSTFIKRFMEELVLPEVTGPKKKRYTDELPQSGSGKTVMTTEPKFIPEEGALLRVKDVEARIRLIDCVGFPVEGASGFEEEGTPRLVKTPWDENAVPFFKAAEEGTQRVIREHSTVAVLVTCDGSVTGIARTAYEEAEEKAFNELKQLNKPFVVVLNCLEPEKSAEACAHLEEKYGAPVVPLNAEKATRDELLSVLERILYEFPVVDIDVEIPAWMRVLDADNPLIAELLAGIRTVAPKICKMSDASLLDTLFTESENLLPPASLQLNAGTGKVVCHINVREGTFYKFLSMECGEEINDEFALMSYCSQLSKAKQMYVRLSQAFDDAQQFGYGIVPPERDEMSLAEPKLVKKKGRVGVNLHADTPSYHIIRVDVSGEVRPALGNEERSKAFVEEIAQKRESEIDSAWNTNMFGRTLKDMLGEELYLKNRAVGETVQKKMRRTMTRIVNEGKGGVICILL